ncbi:MAG: transposase [Candidatus Thiodiazotropha sp. L084R]
MEATLQSIFRSTYESYRKEHGLSMEQIKAAQAIMDCQSEALGHEEWVCRNDGHVERQHHSCRHRSCPRCNGSQSREWLEKIKAKLLPCDHYHVVFTLPHELNAIWQYNRSWCSDRLFQATAETLRELLKDERYLGAEVGLISSLHTWGRTFVFHPHMHVLVTGLGLRREETRQLEKDFLLPVGVLKAKFRGKWLSYLNQAYDRGDITLPEDWTELEWRRVLRKVARKSWNIRIQGAYKHGDGVALYLSRYVRGGPVKDKKIISANKKRVIFQYKDHHDGKNKMMPLPTEHFTTRVLWHVAVKGQHQVRHYGLYASSARVKRDKVREKLGIEVEQAFHKPEEVPKTCPECGHVLFHAMSTRREISYIKSGRVIHVQQAVATDRDRSDLPIGWHSIDTSPPFFYAVRRPLN